MPDSSLDRSIVGCLLILVGLAIIIFHKAIKESRDRWMAKDFPVGFGQNWSGKYTHGGLIFTNAVIIIIGVVFVLLGIAEISGFYVQH